MIPTDGTTSINLAEVASTAKPQLSARADGYKASLLACTASVRSSVALMSVDINVISTSSSVPLAVITASSSPVPLAVITASGQTPNTVVELHEYL